MARLLMLGGSDLQVHAIERAVAAGHHVITCDNRPENPGHRLANEFHPISTTDPAAVVDLARRRRVDGVVAYASDPAAVTAAAVADELSLPGDPVASVEVVQDKLRFRAAQRSCGLPVPRFTDGADPVARAELTACAPFGVVVKPTDRSGSAGISVLPRHPSSAAVDVALRSAAAESLRGRVIVEERLRRDGKQVNGNFLVESGEILYSSFEEQYLREAQGGYVSIGNLAPPSVAPETLAAARAQVAQLVGSVGLKRGVYNAEFIRDQHGRVVMLDFGARIGGNLIAEIHELLTGIDLVGIILDLALGQPITLPDLSDTSGAVGHLVVHAEAGGILEAIEFSDHLRRLVRRSTPLVAPGTQVRPYRSSADRLGVVVLQSDDRDDLLRVYSSPHEHLGVKVR